MRKQLLLAGAATAILLLGTSAAASAADIVVSVDPGRDLTCTNSTLGDVSDIDRALAARVRISFWLEVL